MNQVRNDVGLLTHDNYATSTGAATKTLPAKTTFILIENMDATNSLLVSFDGGSNYKTIVAGKALSLSFSNALSSYKIKSSASTPNAECLYGSEA